MKSLKNLCQRSEEVIMELFNRGGWNFRSRIEMKPFGFALVSFCLRLCLSEEPSYAMTACVLCSCLLAVVIQL